MLVYQRVSSPVFFFPSKKSASNIEIFCLKDWDFIASNIGIEPVLTIKHWGLKHQELGLSHQSAGVDIVSQSKQGGFGM